MLKYFDVLKLFQAPQDRQHQMTWFPLFCVVLFQDIYCKEIAPDDVATNIISKDFGIWKQILQVYNTEDQRRGIKRGK